MEGGKLKREGKVFTARKLITLICATVNVMEYISWFTLQTTLYDSLYSCPSTSVVCWWVKLLDKDHFPAMGTTQSVQLLSCVRHNKYNHLCIQIYLKLQLHIKSCKKSDDIIPVKRTGSMPLFPFCQPKSKGDLTGGLAR